MLPLLYSYNREKFNNKMNEKRSQKYQIMDPGLFSGIDAGDGHCPCFGKYIFPQLQTCTALVLSAVHLI